MAQNQLGGKSFHVLDVRGPVSRSYEFAITDEISRAIFEGMSAPADGQFLRTLTRNLAIAVQVRFAFIATLLEAKPGYARLSAMWTGNGFGESLVTLLKERLANTSTPTTLCSSLTTSSKSFPTIPG